MRGARRDRIPSKPEAHLKALKGQKRPVLDSNVHGVERESLQRPEGREGQKGRQPETASQLRRDAKLQGAGPHLPTGVG
jgi:hypothetical protein